nr:hypothetical protein L203_04095 [Cryptococcus depauperatus CBS 7841]
MSTRNTLSLSLWRPDTTASDINEDDLPRQQLFLQDNSDEDGEDDDKVPDDKTTWDNGMLGAKSNDHRVTDIEMGTIDEDSPYPQHSPPVPYISPLIVHTSVTIHSHSSPCCTTLLSTSGKQ